MTKNKYLLLILIFAFTLIGCGKNGGGSSSNEESGLPGLSEEYSPRGLSDKVFTKSGKTYAPMNFLSQDLRIVFDPATSEVTGTTTIRFSLKKPGRPYFELKATPSNVEVNSGATTVASVTDPDGQNQSYWSLSKELEPGIIHTVTFNYELPSGRVTFSGGGVRFLTDMTDLSGKFFEYWGPVGFEEDGFAMNLTLEVPGTTSNHFLRTNGKITSSSSTKWKINFPDFYSKSSFYVHLTNQTLPSKKLVIQGMDRDIPVEVYGVTQSLVDSAVKVLPGLFKELEGDYGPYPHDKFLAYLNDRSGGMEYVAATITSVASIDHELLHSWFARSVIPADGRSGWIDEAMASWRDYGYSTAKSTLGRSPTNMADYSPYRKTTPSNSYVDGRALFAELDLELAQSGGLKNVMKAFFERYKNKVMTNEEFWYFLETYTSKDLSAFNKRYALGGAQQELYLVSEETDTRPSKHPTPLTEEEILRLR